MNTRSFSNRKTRRRARPRNQRGVALITSLLLLTLLMAMSLTMVLAVSSDMLVNGYYGNERGSFYAADAGANIARQAVINGLKSSVPASFGASSQPIAPGTNTTVQNNVSSTYYSPTSVNTSGSWPEKFYISSLAVGTPTCSVSVIGGPTGTLWTCTTLPSSSATPPVTGITFKYSYPYQITSVGQAQGTEATTLNDYGNLLLTVSVAPTGGTPISFASFGTFLNSYGDCQAPFVAGTLTGPFFTNGQWNFGDSNALGSTTKYVFTDTTGQAGAQVSYWHGGSCDDAAAASDTANGTTIAPTFQAGLNLSQAPITLPQNDYNQKQAVLDGIGNTSTAPTNANLNAVLKNVNGTPYPTGGTTSGVYVPYSVNSSTGAKTFTGGGIYVEGDANVTLPPAGTNGEMYTIVQNGVTTTVTVNPASNTTTITSGTVTNTITGVPSMYDTSGAFVQDATMLYVDGNITSLAGPGEYTTAINNGVALTVTAAQTMTVTGDIRYATEPVYTSGSQVDQLNTSGNTGQVLGLFTATGDIQMNNGQSDGNLEIDASLAMISQSSSGGWINVGPHINTLNVVGGRIAMQAKSGNTTTRNIYYDRRFASGNFAPPWFPSTTLGTSSTDSTKSVTSTVQRTLWQFKSATQ